MCAGLLCFDRELAVFGSGLSVLERRETVVDGPAGGDHLLRDGGLYEAGDVEFTA